ncbi:MAG: hypothetical protein ACN4GG_09685 [Akkermansiaceae bacterium]
MIKTIYSLLATLVFVSCSPTLSPSQKSQIQSVKIATPQIKEKAYQEPQGGSDTARSAAAATGVAGGAIGGLVGGLIGEGIYATQHNSFKNEHGKSFSSIQSKVPEKLQLALQKEITTQVKANSFFAGKVKSSAPYQITSEIFSHGLRRVGKDSNGQLLLTPVIRAQIFLISPDGEKWLRSGHLVGVGTQKAALQTYLKNPALIRQGYREAISSLGVAVAKDLKRGTKTK